MDNLPAVQSPFDEPNEEIDLRRAWQTVARSAWIIVVCVGLAVAAAVVAARRIVPQYGAAATVRLVEQPKGSSPQSAMMYFGNETQSSLAMAAEVITSRTLASEVVDSLGLRLYVIVPPRVVRSTLIAHAQFVTDAPSVQYRITKVPAGREVRVLPEDSVLGVFPDTGALKLIGGSITLSGEGRALPKMTVAVDPRVAIAEALRSQLVVQPTNKDANVLMISYSGPDSQLVRDIPNAVAHAFVRKRMELDRGGALQRMEFLRRQRATLSADVADAEAAIRAYLEKEGISGVAEQQQALQSQLLPQLARSDDGAGPELRFMLTPSTPGSPDLLVLCMEVQTQDTNAKLFRRRAETATAGLYWETDGSMQSAYRLPYDLADGFSSGSCQTPS